MRARWAFILLTALLPTAAQADFQNLGQAYPITFTNAGTLAISAGGTAQQLLPANPGRRALFVENPCSASEDLFIEFGAPISTTLTSGMIDIPACGNLTMGIGIVSQQQVEISATTTGHAFIAKEGT